MRKLILAITIFLLTISPSYAASTSAQAYNSTIDTLLIPGATGTYWNGASYTTPAGSGFIGASVDVTDPIYGGDNAGAIDSTAAFNAAEAALPASGGRIITHGGIYKLCSLGTTFTITKPIDLDFEGGTINFACATTNGIFVNTTGAQNTHIHNFQATSTVAHTSNYFFKITSLNIKIDQFTGYNYYRFMDIEDSQTVHVRDYYLSNTVVGGGSGDFFLGCTTGNGDVDIKDGYSTDPDISHMASVGINACSGDGYTFEDDFSILHGNDIVLTPQAGQTLANVHIKNSTPDTASNGIVVQPAGGGVVTDLTIDDTWASVQTGDGILLDATGGSISNVVISGGNRITSSNNGIHTVGNVSNLSITEGNDFSNTTGLNISSGTTGRIGCDFNNFGNTTNLTGGSGMTGCASGGGGGTSTIVYGGFIGSIAAGGSASISFPSACPTALKGITASLIGGPTTLTIPAAIVSYSSSGAVIGNASSIGPLGASWIAVCN